MYPDLSYIFHDLFGSPVDSYVSHIKTFGLFLMLTFIVAFILLLSEFKRKIMSGRIILPSKKILIGAAPSIKKIIPSGVTGISIGIIIGLILKTRANLSLSLSPFIARNIIGLTALLLGLIFALGRYIELKRLTLPNPEVILVKKKPWEYALNILIVAIVFGVLGARLLSILENFDDFLANPLEQLIFNGGLTIYGGILLAFAAVFTYVKYNGLNPKEIMDIAAPILIIGYGIGRLGCHFSGDGDWGMIHTMSVPDWWILPDWLWSYDYPNNVTHSHSYVPETGAMKYAGVKMVDCGGYGEGAIYCTKLRDPVYPTPVYEAIISFITFGIFWLYRKRIKISGLLFCYYLIWSGTERFLIEFIRVNERYQWLGLELSLSQYIGLLFVIAGIVGALLLRRKRV